MGDRAFGSLAPLSAPSTAGVLAWGSGVPGANDRLIVLVIRPFADRHTVVRWNALVTPRVTVTATTFPIGFVVTVDGA